MLSETSTEPLNVLLVAMDPVTSRTLRETLAEDGDIRVSGQAADGPEALAAVSAGGVDIAIVDVDAPPIEALTLTPELRRHARVVLLAANEDPDLAVRGLLAGAIGYLRKDALGGELRRALRGVAHGEAAVSRRLTAELVDLLRRRGDGAD
jgi:DNA-binding NarL/FixJ family response regulator